MATGDIKILNYLVARLIADKEGITPVEVLRDAFLHYEGADEVKAPKERGYNFRQALRDVGVDDKVIRSWMTVREKKRLSNTEIAFEELCREAGKVHITVPQAVEFSARHGWGGFQAEWYENASTRDKQQQMFDDRPNV